MRVCSWIYFLEFETDIYSKEENIETRLHYRNNRSRSFVVCKITCPGQLVLRRKIMASRKISFNLLCLFILLYFKKTGANNITYHIAEELPVDAFVGNVSADSKIKDIVGENTANSIRYSILSSGNGNNILFKINTTTGVLTIGSRLDREQLWPSSDNCELNLEVAAQSSSPPFFSNIKIKIIVEDINDNSPVFTKSTLPIDVSEAASLNLAIPLEAASDLDASKNFSIRNYALERADVPFKIVHTENLVGIMQLNLVVSGQLDRENVSSYSLKVWAFDGDQPPRSGSTTVILTVLDVNDNAPRFAQDEYALSINESTPLGTSILTVTATDSDEGENSRITYSISQQQAISEQQKLAINSSSGIVSLAQVLRVGIHRVVIQAQDNGSPSKFIQVIVEVNVLDTDNSPPVLFLDLLSVMDMHPGYVPESARIGTAVAYLAVSDADSDMTANGVVTCNITSNAFDLQLLAKNEYKVIVSTSLDRENTSFYDVLITCVDQGSPPLKSSENFAVWLLDVNDNPPVFLESNYNASIAENNGPNDGLLQVAATDADAGNNANITFKLFGAGEKFQINSSSGMIRANSRFDYEDAHQFVFFVLAIDRGFPPLSATATVTVNILDINDEAPMFSSEEYAMSVNEEDSAGAYVGNVSTLDPDSGQGGEVTYSIIQPAESPHVPFTISQEGIITTTRMLDREQNETYSFLIMAKDHGSQPNNSTAMVTVTVLDVNDNEPVFTYPPDGNASEVLYVPVDSKFNVCNVRAFDADSDYNAVIAYSIIGGNASNFFQVDRKSGAVMTIVPLDERALGVYYLVIQASDQGSSPHCKNGTLVMSVNKQQAEMLDDATLSDQYVLIVICIVVFTAVVSAAVLTTLCVLRKMDQDKMLKYGSTCCPHSRNGANNSTVGSMASARDQNPMHAMTEGLSTKMASRPKPDSVYGSRDMKCSRPSNGDNDAKTNGILRFAHQRSSNAGSSQMQMPLSQQHGGRIPAHLDLLTMHVKGDDFHSTSSAETNTGDSGHGSDEDLPVYTLNNYPIALSPTQIQPGGIFSITRTTPPSLGPPSRSCKPISFIQRWIITDANASFAAAWWKAEEKLVCLSAASHSQERPTIQQ